MSFSRLSWTCSDMLTTPLQRILSSDVLSLGLCVLLVCSYIVCFCFLTLLRPATILLLYLALVLVHFLPYLKLCKVKGHCCHSHPSACVCRSKPTCCAVSCGRPTCWLWSWSPAGRGHLSRTCFRPPREHRTQWCRTSVASGCLNTTTSYLSSDKGEPVPSEGDVDRARDYATRTTSASNQQSKNAPAEQFDTHIDHRHSKIKTYTIHKPYKHTLNPVTSINKRTSPFDLIFGGVYGLSLSDCVSFSVVQWLLWNWSRTTQVVAVAAWSFTICITARCRISQSQIYSFTIHTLDFKLCMTFFYSLSPSSQILQLTQTIHSFMCVWFNWLISLLCQLMAVTVVTRGVVCGQ